MFRLQYLLLIAMALSLSSHLSAQAELNGDWRQPIVTPLTDPLEIRAADMETYVDPNNPIVPVVILGINPGGGTNLGVYDVFPYLNTPFPDIPPQNVVDASFHPLDIGTNNIFAIDGIVGNSAGINLLAACVDGGPSIIRINGTQVVNTQILSQLQCNEMSITSVPGIADVFYASFYTAGNQTISILKSDDGGDVWQNYYQITGNFGGTPVGAANGGVRHDIAGFNTANDPDASITRAGLCINFTEAVDNGPNGLQYGIKCLEDVNGVPNNFFSEGYDQGFFPLDTIAELRSKSTQNGEIATIYPKEIQEALQNLKNWDFTSVDGLGSPNPSVSNPVDVAEADDELAVVTANAILLGVSGEITYFAQEDDQKVIIVDENNPFSGAVVKPANIGNYPCNQSTENIVTPIGLGYAMTGPTTGAVFIACPGGSLLISELLLSGPSSVPTLSEWGLISLIALMLLSGVFLLRRRTQAVNN